MPVSVTREQLEAMQPCGLEDRLLLFGKRKKLTAKQALAAGATVFDLLWVAGRLGMKHACVQFALRVAQRTAYLNTDPCVQAALDATQAWLDASTVANAVYATYAATYAATYTAYAVYAAKAANAAYVAAYAAKAAKAANAAYVAAYAANAAYAAYAAANAANAADAADATEQEAQKAIFLEIFG